jgi:hypothetical protein
MDLIIPSFIISDLRFILEIRWSAVIARQLLTDNESFILNNSRNLNSNIINNKCW